jgi:predicted metal-dependent hydrolase
MFDEAPEPLPETKANRGHRRKPAKRITTLTLDASSIAYRLRRSARTKRLRITVRPGGVEVVAPWRAPEADIAAFVAHHRSWIETKTAALQRLLATHPGSARLVDGARIPCRGRTVGLRVVAGVDRKARVDEGDCLEIGIPAAMTPGHDEAAIERAVTTWLKAQARIDAEAHVARHGPPHGLIPSSIRIKEQKRLWGSCTARGAINLNWRLILAPPAVFEYVVVHELCHLRVPSHQPPFWRLVGQVLPGFEAQRHWLRGNGHLLTLRPGAIG